MSESMAPPALPQPHGPINSHSNSDPSEGVAKEKVDMAVPGPAPPEYDLQRNANEANEADHREMEGILAELEQVNAEFELWSARVVHVEKELTAKLTNEINGQKDAYHKQEEKRVGYNLAREKMGQARDHVKSFDG